MLALTFLQLERLRRPCWLPVLWSLLVITPLLVLSAVAADQPPAAAEPKPAEAAGDSISVGVLKKHAALLSSDTLEGREAGTRGGRAAGVYLAEQLRKFGLRGGGTGGGYFQEFGYNYRNVLALLPGRDPALKNEVIVVGAHYDHVGYGNQGNSYGPAGYIHNGADDNASGTAVLLAVAEACARLETPPARTILFAFWDAEEIGLLGSKHWIAQPTVPLRQVRLAINADMVGRLRNRTLTVYGVRTGAGLRRLVCEQNRATGLSLHFDWDVDEDSDHYPFYERRIPFLMLHTEKHEDYHRPSDEFSKLNLAGMQEVARLMFDVVQAAADLSRLPAFRPASVFEREPDRLRLERPLPPLPSRLGVTYDNQLAAQGVIEVRRVAADSPAARAGLQPGDRIMEFADQPVGGDADFRTLVLRAESPVSLLIGRPGAEQATPLTVELDGRPMRLGVSWRTDDAAPGEVILSRVVPGSPAALAGLRVNDSIYEVGGRRFSTADEFRHLIAECDDALPLTVERRGRLHRIEVTLPALLRELVR